MRIHPVAFELARPARFERFQVIVRLLVLLAASALRVSLGALLGLLWLLLPAFAAVQSSVKGGARYLAEDGPRLQRLLRFVLGLHAYLIVLTDRLPRWPGPQAEEAAEAEAALVFHVDADGQPGPASALWRLVTSIPAVLYLALLGVLSLGCWVVQMVLVAITGDYPDALFQLQSGIVRYEARLLAFQASLVEAYPPWSLGGQKAEAPAATPPPEDLHQEPAPPLPTTTPLQPPPSPA